MAKRKPKSEPKAKAAADPDKLVRQSAGSYTTADERFEARGADGGWFLVDTEQANEFGQELMLGPFPTLKAVREAIPGARESKAQPKPMRPKTTAAPERQDKGQGKGKGKGEDRGKAAEPEPPPPPPSWIDQLSKAEASSVRRLIAALGAEGIDDAEELVRRDHDGLLPAIAVALIERRLEALVEEAPAGERETMREVVRRAAEILSSAGAPPKDPLPGWALVEVGPEPMPANRRIDLRE